MSGRFVIVFEKRFGRNANRTEKRCEHIGIVMARSTIHSQATIVIFVVLAQRGRPTVVRILIDGAKFSIGQCCDSIDRPIRPGSAQFGLPVDRLDAMVDKDFLGKLFGPKRLRITISMMIAIVRARGIGIIRVAVQRRAGRRLVLSPGRSIIIAPFWRAPPDRNFISFIGRVVVVNIGIDLVLREIIWKFKDNIKGDAFTPCSQRHCRSVNANRGKRKRRNADRNWNSDLPTVETGIGQRRQRGHCWPAVIIVDGQRRPLGAADVKRRTATHDHSIGHQQLVSTLQDGQVTPDRISKLVYFDLVFGAKILFGLEPILIANVKTGVGFIGRIGTVQFLLTVRESIAIAVWIKWIGDKRPAGQRIPTRRL